MDNHHPYVEVNRAMSEPVHGGPAASGLNRASRALPAAGLPIHADALGHAVQPTLLLLDNRHILLALDHLLRRCGRSALAG